MKSVAKTLLLLLLLSCFAGTASSQIRDDESSQVVLAVQCAVSSGYSASDFEDYSRRLAKTLSLLTSTQQRKVFGYLPQPAAVSSGDTQSAYSPGRPTPADEAPVNTNPVPGADSKETDPGLLAGLVGDLNKALSGTSSASTAVYGGEPVSVDPVVSALVKGETAENVKEINEVVSSARKNGYSWGAIVSWLNSLTQRSRL